MTELSDWLFLFLNEQRMSGIWNNADYMRFSAAAHAREQALRAHLDPDGVQLLDDMLAEYGKQFSVEMETMFQATMGLCAELERLLTPPPS